MRLLLVRATAGAVLTLVVMPLTMAALMLAMPVTVALAVAAFVIAIVMVAAATLMVAVAMVVPAVAPIIVLLGHARPVQTSRHCFGLLLIQQGDGLRTQTAPPITSSMS